MKKKLPLLSRLREAHEKAIELMEETPVPSIENFRGSQRDKISWIVQCLESALCFYVIANPQEFGVSRYKVKKLHRKLCLREGYAEAESANEQLMAMAIRRL